MRAGSGTIFRRLVPGLVFGFVVLLGLALLGDLRQVQQVMLDFDWRLFPLVILLTLFNYLLRFLKWHFYLWQLGIRHFPWYNSLRLFVGGFPLAVTPGKVGEVLKGVWLNQFTGLPVGRGISVVVAERISDGLAVLLLSVVGVVAFPQFWSVFLAVLVGLLSVVVLSQIRPAAQLILSFGERLPILRRFVPGAREFYEGSFSLFQPLTTLLAVGLGFVSWLGEGIGFYLILIGLGMPPSERLAAMAIFVLSFSTIIGAVSTLPGGLGAAEASIAGMLTLVLAGTPWEVTSATLLVRLATLWFGVGLGLLVWLVSPNLIGLRSGYASVVER